MKESTKIQKEINELEEYIRDFKETVNDQFYRQGKHIAYYLGDKFTEASSSKHINSNLEELGDLKNKKDEAMAKEKNKRLGGLEEPGKEGEEIKVTKPEDYFEVVDLARDSEGNPLDEDGEIDWYLDYENIPSNVKEVIYQDKFESLNQGDSDYLLCEQLNNELNDIGWCIKFGLDGQPTNLEKIGEGSALTQASKSLLKNNNKTEEIMTQFKVGDMVEIPTLKVSGTIKELDGDIATVTTESGLAVSNVDKLVLANATVDSVMEGLGEKKEDELGERDFLTAVNLSKNDLFIIMASISDNISDLNKILEKSYATPETKKCVMEDIKEKEILLLRLNQVY